MKQKEFTATETYKGRAYFYKICIRNDRLDPEITNIKKIGSDMEKAIYNGVKAIIPDVGQLYCV